MITLRDLTEDYCYFLAVFLVFKCLDLVFYRLSRMSSSPLRRVLKVVGS